MASPILIFDLKAYALRNEKSKRLVRKGENGSVYVMSLKPGETVPCEIHLNTDQVLEVYQGNLVIYINGDFHMVREGQIAYIDAHTKHKLVNSNRITTVKLSTTYTNKDHESETLDCK